MDFVVVGLGLGALIAILGFMLRDLIPLLAARAKSGQGTTPSRYLIPARMEAASTGLCACGGALILATIAAVLLDLSDSAGAVAVVTGGVVGLLAAAVLTVGLDRLRPARLPVSLPKTAGAWRSPPPAIADRNGPPAVEDGQLPSLVVHPAGDALSSPPSVEEPFDVNRLLPEELGTHEPAPIVEQPPAAAPAPSLPVDETPEAEAQAVTESEPAPVAATEPAEQIGTEQPEPPRPFLVPGTPSERWFESPLLADIAVDRDAVSLDRPFSSAILADLQAGDESSGERISALLAEPETAKDEPQPAVDAGPGRDAGPLDVADDGQAAASAQARESGDN